MYVNYNNYPSSCLISVPGFSLVHGVSIDYMHCVLLGVCRQLLKLWFVSKHHKELWYIGKQTTVIDSRLSSIKPPREVNRTPRSLDTIKFWKG